MHEGGSTRRRNAGMSWEQMLAEFQRLLGRRVIVTASPVDPDPDRHVGPGMLVLDGVLVRGEPSQEQEFLRLLGMEQPGEEALSFTVEPNARLTVARSRFVEAGRSGVGTAFYVVQGGAMVQVADWEEARKLTARFTPED
jgi:hypothetical protein